MNSKKLYVSVLLALPLREYYTYSVPESLAAQVKIGVRVIVNFGAKKFYSGIIVDIFENDSINFQVKDIEEILDSEPICNQSQFDFWKWISFYYMCSEGEVMNAALPSGLKITSQSGYAINPLFDDNFDKLTDEEYLIVEGIIKNESLTVEQIQTILNRKNVHSLIKNLIETCVIYPQEEISEKYIPKKQTFLKINSDYENEGVLNAFLNNLEKKAPIQYQCILQYFGLSAGNQEVKKIDLSKKSSPAAIKSLIQKNFFYEYEKVVSRIKLKEQTSDVSNITLSPAQNQAYNEILNFAAEKKPILLHGITGSGKTEIYIKLIEKAFSEGKQVLYLLPEIALTEFTVTRLKKYFGSKLLVYHSRFNLHEKVEIWNYLIKKDSPVLVMGPRSALFLPFRNLDLIIIDEEHDNSYKQHDPAPRYHARDAAVVLAKKLNINLLLGSATPSAESWYNCTNGNYNLVKLYERYGNAKLPNIKIVDIKQATIKKEMFASLSSELYEATKKSLDENKQIILFQNRRGFSTWIECQECGWTPTCRHCDVTMTYHKNIDLLKCHYCGYTERNPVVCPKCKSPQIKMKGMGTERIEDDMAILFPNTSIARMDIDNTRGKNSLQNLLDGFDTGKYRILVGTQMISKGLDFGKVDIVGILNADNLLSFPSFRAHENAFQLMTQVAGRAGRRNNAGNVYIQVYDKDNPVVKYVANNDYEGFIFNELNSRQKYSYPPFCRLLQICIKNKDKEIVGEASSQLAILLRKHIDEKNILGPVYPIISRIKNYYIREIMIKFPRNGNSSIFKQKLTEQIDLLKKNPKYKSCLFVIDVDPS